MAGSYYVNQERWLGSEVLTGSVVAGPKGSASLVLVANANSAELETLSMSLPFAF